MSGVKNIQHSKIRLFPLQTRDSSFIMFPDLPTSYLITFLTEKCNFKRSQFTIDYVYPFQKYVEKTLHQICTYEEDYFVFYLENYYHSSDFALGFVDLALEVLNQKKGNKPRVIIHTHKADFEDCNTMIQKYDFVEAVLRTDLEYYFYELFVQGNEVSTIPNILYRDEKGKLHINEDSSVSHDLSDYVLGAYYNGMYAHFPKSKEQIISLLDDDDELTDETVYYRWPKKKFIESFRYLWQAEAMLTT